jgi:hypothetical protein
MKTYVIAEWGLQYECLSVIPLLNNHIVKGTFSMANAC